MKCNHEFVPELRALDQNHQFQNTRTRPSGLWLQTDADKKPDHSTSFVVSLACRLLNWVNAIMNNCNNNNKHNNNVVIIYTTMIIGNVAAKRYAFM